MNPHYFGGGAEKTGAGCGRVNALGWSGDNAQSAALITGSPFCCTVGAADDPSLPADGSTPLFSIGWAGGVSIPEAAFLPAALVCSSTGGQGGFWAGAGVVWAEAIATVKPSMAAPASAAGVIRLSFMTCSLLAELRPARNAARINASRSLAFRLKSGIDQVWYQAVCRVLSGACSAGVFSGSGICRNRAQTTAEMRANRASP